MPKTKSKNKKTIQPNRQQKDELDYEQLEPEDRVFIEMLDTFSAFVNGQYTLKDAKGVSDESIEVTYALAHQMYTKRKFDKALKLFKYLVYLDYFDKRFWKGMGACYQMQENFEKATEAYGFATLLDGHDGDVPLQAAYCYMAMNQKEEAKKALQSAIYYAGKEGGDKDIMNKAKGLLEILQADTE